MDRRRARRGRAPAARRGDRRARSWCCRSSRPGPRPWRSRAGLTPSLYSDAALERLGGRGRRSRRRRPREDRHGHAPGRACIRPRRRRRSSSASIEAGLRVEGAVDPFRQLRRGRDDHAACSWSASWRSSRTSGRPGVEPELLHAANSGATILYPETHLDLVRPGIAIYGLEPAPGVGDAPGAAPGAHVAFDGRARPRGCPPGNACPTDTGTGWSATRTWPPCRWATPTATLTSCRLGQTS